MVGQGVEAGRVYIGRRHELDRIGKACRAVRAGEGGVLVVVGPAGIGKSRLAEEGARQAVAAGLRVAWGRCWTGGGAPALWPWPTVLEQLCDPATAALLADDDPTSDAIDPERFTRFVTIGRRLTSSCADRPALLVLDDLHAAGPAALLLTRYLARVRPLPAMLLLITTRDGVTATELAESPPLPLQPFDLADTGAFLAAHHSAGPSELVRAVHRVTGGNPFQLHRVVGGDWITGPAGGLRDLVGDEVSRLPALTRRLGAVAAVLGPTAPIALVAAVADVPAGRVMATVAATPGLIEKIGFDQIGFAHELVRAAFLNTLPADALLDTHARVAAVLRGWSGLAPHDRLARRAHHTAAAALRSPADAERAVTACRAAAASMMDRYAYEEAARLLATAAGLGPPDATLLVEWACAVLAAGRLAEARELFQRAADAAATAADPVLGAQAALGLGGVWVDEHRVPGERERVRAQQQAALDRLPATGGHAVLRARLRMRLAAEAVYTGAPLEPVHQALADCRLLGDAAALAEALSLTHHVLLRPDHSQDRPALAAELVSVAATAGDGVLVLMGMCWRAVDLFTLGDPAAHRALAELRHRADTVGCRSILHVAAAMNVMLLIRSGRLTDENDNPIWPRCDGLIWPHPCSCADGPPVTAGDGR